VPGSRDLRVYARCETRLLVDNYALAGSANSMDGGKEGEGGERGKGKGEK